MAFGRRSTVGTPAVGVAAPGNRGRRTMGRRKRGAASTIASNKVFGGSETKMANLSAASGRKMVVASAIMGEKFTRLGADMKLRFYTISHPLHPLRRVAAREQNVNVKAAASEWKRQKMARAVDVEMRKRAIVRERRAARLQTAL